ncbi:MAG: mandelate racemase/muconate lactonizing enzyme family protein [Verrucomicrobia bacterium]|nr:mandelate racemase/muconate lactonizing enzyme family protein [Verrucomicrobiota bacterium]
MKLHPSPIRSHWSRRDVLRLGAGLIATSCLAPYRALAAAEQNKIKITRIQAMAIRNIAGNCLIRIDTDQGLSGYGEAGATGPMARARIETMKNLLIGRDPLTIEVHFHNMTTLMHTYMAHIPTISGIDIALWDLAGKILHQPVSKLLGGPFRDAIPLYSHGSCNMLDPGSCRAWAQRVKEQPEGFTAFKIGPDSLVGGVSAGRYAATLNGAQFQRVARGFANLREAVGDEIDLGVHCHNEYDTPSAIGMAKAVEPMRPMFLEDPLNVPYSEGWTALKRSSSVPLLTGEKLELVRGFKPFLDNQAVDYVHPDLAFAGGITGTKKIADYAALTRTPVALHNVGSLVLCYANAHFGASIQNFFRSESALGRPDHYTERMARSNPPVVRKGMLSVPEGPGLGVNLDEDFLRNNLQPGEPYWSY